MQRHECTTLVFSGRIAPDSMADFVAHRGARLALDWTILSLDAAGLTVRVAGQADLVDAFEMACSLGTEDSLIRDVARLDNGAPPAATTRDERAET